VKFVININTLLKYSITAEQYSFLYLLASEELSILEKYLSLFNSVSLEDLDRLKNIGLITFISSNISDIKVTNKARDILELNKLDNYITELWKLFPSMTPNGRKLKQCSKKTAEITYNKCHENIEENHNKIMEALNKEIEHRRLNGSMDYMQNIKTWLYNRSYEAFMEDNNDNSLDIAPKFV